ncbi:unnamed protein product [Pieris macdunnoughi]|uniref:Uncharacterized protein n=1 Tax=Pieris macdunnoughi TaxID=345717 RepID=A0A821SJA1_9NEOP|nr:unnamed protein product [Pieris macdunnoughi]
MCQTGSHLFEYFIEEKDEANTKKLDPLARNIEKYSPDIVAISHPDIGILGAPTLWLYRTMTLGYSQPVIVALSYPEIGILAAPTLWLYRTPTLGYSEPRR